MRCTSRYRCLNRTIPAQNGTQTRSSRLGWLGRPSEGAIFVCWWLARRRPAFDGRRSGVRFRRGPRTLHTRYWARFATAPDREDTDKVAVWIDRRFRRLTERSLWPSECMHLLHVLPSQPTKASEHAARSQLQASAAGIWDGLLIKCTSATPRGSSSFHPAYRGVRAQTAASDCNTGDRWRARPRRWAASTCAGASEAQAQARACRREAAAVRTPGKAQDELETRGLVRAEWTRSSCDCETNRTQKHPLSREQEDLRTGGGSGLTMTRVAGLAVHRPWVGSHE